MAADPAVETSGDGLPQADRQVRELSILVLLIGIAVATALPFALSAGSEFFLPVTSAVVLSVAIAPVADALNRVGLPNALASMLALLILIAMLGLILFLIIQPSFDLISGLPHMLGRIAERLENLRSSFRDVTRTIEQVSQVGGASKQRTVVLASPSLLEEIVVATPGVVISLMVTLLMTFFMVESRDRLRRRLLLERSDFGASLRAARAIRAVQERVGSYIATVSVINLGVGVLVGLLSWAFGLDAPVMWGGLAALLNFLPYVGPLAMGGLLLAFGLGTADELWAGLLPAAAYLSIHLTEANIVTPAILGRKFTLNPVVILMALSYFTWVWGIVGAFLAVPILLVLLALFEHIGSPNIVGFVLGEDLFPHSQQKSGPHEGATPTGVT